MSKYVVCALYRFVKLEDFQDIKEPLLEVMHANNIRGTLLLANEGINGTIAGMRHEIDAVLVWLQSDDRFTSLSWKESFSEGLPFKRTRVKLKKEIVTMGVDGIDPSEVVGTYVKPADWNALISDPEVLLIDTRNDYEIEIGQFTNAINPKTDSFREFPDYIRKNVDPSKHKKVAMYCTGGIRCEKSTALLKQQGFEQVFHLEGGILKYLEDVPESETLWEGECFVFDERVAVNHKLEKGQYDLCSACRFPITEREKSEPEYEQGISCHKCFGKHSVEQIERFRERQLQIQLAEKRGDVHIGADAAKSVEKRRLAKQKMRAKQNEQTHLSSRKKS